MRSAAFSAISKTAHTAMMLIAVLTFMTSYANAQQRKTIVKLTIQLDEKSLSKELIVITRTKQLQD